MRNLPGKSNAQRMLTLSVEAKLNSAEAENYMHIVFEIV